MGGQEDGQGHSLPRALGSMAPQGFSTAEVVFMRLVWSISPCSHLQDLSQKGRGQDPGLCTGWLTL